jgi:Putative DNA-binding domain
MIPKPLNEIEWADIEALRDSGREEDDTIEYKGSFSGGSDYLAFNESKRAKAIEGIAREAVAFLNGRGGDIIIGAREAANDHPKIEEITPVSNIDQTVSRLEQSLAALIEPVQTVLGIRAVRKFDGDADGVIIVRCPSSLRAPHRFTPTKECYTRRGRSSVPMRMDEVQDLTLRRADLRRERLQLLTSQFDDFDTSRAGRTNLSDHRFQIRSVFIPLQGQEIQIDEELCAALRGEDPLLVRSGKSERIDLPFRDLGFNWRPVLRGKRLETYVDHAWSKEDFIFCAKEVRHTGVLMSDFACRVSVNEGSDGTTGFYQEWIAGYLANTLYSFSKVWRKRPEVGQGVLRVAVRSAGKMVAVVGPGMWGNNQFEWPSGVTVLPDFPILDGSGFASVFAQSQVDTASIIGLELPSPFEFASAE